MLLAALGCAGTVVACFLYLTVWVRGVRGNKGDFSPAVIQTATLCAVLTWFLYVLVIAHACMANGWLTSICVVFLVSMVVACWGIWGWLTPIIMGVLGVACIFSLNFVPDF